MKTTYSSTTKRLIALLKNHEFTYDLLWALFKPNAVAYTICLSADKPRCVKYDFGEERSTNNGVQYDGKVFEETSIKSSSAANGTRYDSSSTKVGKPWASGPSYLHKDALINIAGEFIETANGMLDRIRNHRKQDITSLEFRASRSSCKEE